MSGARLLLSYNIIPQVQQEYMNYVINEFIPALESLGLRNTGVWHTAYGNYPIRLLVFVSDDPESMKRALASNKWEEAENRLKTFVTDYSHRVVPADSRFRF